MNLFKLLEPRGRRRKWRVEGLEDGKVVGIWKCDSEEIAVEVLSRLMKGKAPGAVARDLRQASGGR